MTPVIFRAIREGAQRIKIWRETKTLHFTGIVVALTVVFVIAIVAIHQAIFETTPSAVPPDAATEAEAGVELPSAREFAARFDALSRHEPLLLGRLLRQQEADIAAREQDQAGLEEDHLSSENSFRDPMPSPLGQSKLEEANPSLHDDSPDATPSKRNLSYLADYVYAEIPPDEKPADLVLASLSGIAVGTAVEEIKRASDAFGMNFSFMKAVAKIESDFDPKQRTGSYIGLFQLNKYEFEKYGSGDITSPRDNAIAAAYKFLTEATLFEWDTHRKPTFSNLYLIHQQGWQGAAEHISHPERIAWKSMCATDEGREKGEKWCKRAVWANTLPAIKRVWKSVDHLTSGAFVTMWRERVDHFYSRYSEATAAEDKH